MKRRGILIGLALVAMALTAVIVSQRHVSAPAPETVAAAAVSAARPPTDPAAPLPVTTLPVANMAQTLNSPSTSAEEDLSTLALLLESHRKIFGGNPVGENEEITAALLGRNPRRVAVLPSRGGFLDSSGRLIDRWGVPYFFHAISGERMEIVTAGPDRKHHTADDLKSEH